MKKHQRRRRFLLGGVEDARGACGLLLRQNAQPCRGQSYLRQQVLWEGNKALSE